MDKQIPLVSVCCITYNHVKYIRQALDGFIRQRTLFPFEVVVHDDASTDGTAEILREYADRYPHLIRAVFEKENQYSKGRKMWRDIMWPLCRGKYIALCEGDDYWIDPLKLQKQGEFLEAHPEYGMIHTDADLFDTRNGRRIPAYHRHKKWIVRSGDPYGDLLVGEYPVFTCTVLFRKELIEKFDYPEERYTSGDTFLWLSLSRLTKFKYVDDSTSTHQLLEESASHSKNIGKMIAFRQSGYALHRHFIEKYGCAPAVAAIVHSKFNRSIFILAIRAGDLALAKESYAALKAAGRVSGANFGVRFLYALIHLPLGPAMFRAVRWGYKRVFGMD